MRLKHSVRVFGVSNELLLALQVADTVFLEHGFECTVTSLRDSKHSDKSKHWTGHAADIRVRHIDSVLIQENITDDIREALNSEFDVVLENKGQATGHIHIEFDPSFHDVSSTI